MQHLHQLIDRVKTGRGTLEGLIVSFTGADFNNNQIDVTAGRACVGLTDVQAAALLNKAELGLNLKGREIAAAAVAAQANTVSTFALLGNPDPDAPAGTRGPKIFIWLKTDGTIVTTNTLTTDEGLPSAPENGPDVFSGVMFVGDLQKGPLREMLKPSVLLAEVAREQVTPAVRDAMGVITTPAVVSNPLVYNEVRRRVLGFGPAYPNM